MTFCPSNLWLAGLARRFLPLMEEDALSVHAQGMMDFGPVSVRPGRQMPMSLPHKTKDAATAMDRSTVLAIACFPLSLLDEENFRKLLSEICVRAAHTFLLDFKLPERNLEWPAFLLFSPLRCSVSRGRLEQQNGMEGMLYNERCRLSVLSRHALYGGAFCGVLVKNEV